MSFLDETGYRHLYQKIVNKVQALWQKVGTATLTTNAKNTSEAINELKQSLDDIGTFTPNNFISANITANTWSSCKTITLQKGKYIINGLVEFAQATTYQYTMRMIVGSDTYKIRNFGNNGGGSNFTILADLNQATSISLSVYTDITTTASGFLQVMKIN